MMTTDKRQTRSVSAGRTRLRALPAVGGIQGVRPRFVGETGAMAKMQLAVVTIGAHDLPQLRRFYWAWGWEPTPRGTPIHTRSDTEGSGWRFTPWNCWPRRRHREP